MQKPWIVIFPDNLADAPVYANADAARAMVERTRQETAGNVDAIALPVALAARSIKLLSLVKTLREELVGRPNMGLAVKHIDDLLREVGEAE